jgi:hypothetical protein
LCGLPECPGGLCASSFEYMPGRSAMRCTPFINVPLFATCAANLPGAPLNTPTYIRRADNGSSLDGRWGLAK